MPKEVSGAPLSAFDPDTFFLRPLAVLLYLYIRYIDKQDGGGEKEPPSCRLAYSFQMTRIYRSVGTVFATSIDASYLSCPLSGGEAAGSMEALFSGVKWPSRRFRVAPRSSSLAMIVWCRQSWMWFSRAIFSA